MNNVVCVLKLPRHDHLYQYIISVSHPFNLYFRNDIFLKKINTNALQYVEIGRNSCIFVLHLFSLYIQ
jgi:hypothetical protein